MSLVLLIGLTVCCWIVTTADSFSLSTPPFFPRQPPFSARAADGDEDGNAEVVQARQEEDMEARMANLQKIKATIAAGKEAAAGDGDGAEDDAEDDAKVAGGSPEGNADEDGGDDGGDGADSDSDLDDDFDAAFDWCASGCFARLFLPAALSSTPRRSHKLSPPFFSCDLHHFRFRRSKAI